MAQVKKRRREQALKKTIFQPFLNTVDLCLEYNQSLKLSHPNAYQRVLLVLQPVFILLYLYDVYSDISVAQVYFKANDYLFAGLTIFFITFHYVLTGFLLAKFISSKLAMHFPAQEVSQAGNSARRVKCVHIFKRLWRILNWTNELILLVFVCVIAVPFLDMSLLFRAIFPFIYYYLGANEDFMLQYAHIRHPMECFLESFPQTIIQVVYWQLNANNTKDSEKWILLSSFAASAFNLFLNLLNLLSAARTSGFSWKRYFSLTINFKGATHLPLLWRQRLNERILIIDRSIINMEKVQRMYLWNQIARRRCVVLCNEEDVRKYTALLKQQRVKSAALIAVDAADFMLEVVTELPWRLIERNQSLSGREMCVYLDFRKIPDLPLLGCSAMAAGNAPVSKNALVEEDEDDLGASLQDDGDDDDFTKDDETENDREKKQSRLQQKQQQQKRAEKKLQTLFERSGERMVAGFISKFHLPPVRRLAMGKQLWLNGLARVSFADCNFNLDDPRMVRPLMEGAPRMLHKAELKQVPGAAHAYSVWEGLRALAQAPNLQMLDLSGNRLGAVGIYGLSHILEDAVLPSTKRLLDLRLRNIGFGSRKDSSSSSSNSINTNSFQCSGAGNKHCWPSNADLRPRIAFLARRAVRLDLSNNSLPCQPMFDVLVQREVAPGEQAVHDLVLENCTFASLLQDHVKEPWKWKTGIKHLSLAGTSVFCMHEATFGSTSCSRPLFSQMLAQGQLQQVQELNLSSTGLTADTPPSWFRKLLAFEHPELQHVHQTCHYPDDVHEEDLPTNQLLPRLRRLDLSSNVLGDSGLEVLVLELAKLSESLQELSLAHVGAGLKGFHKLLSTLCNRYNWQHKKLTFLDVSYNAGYLLSHGALGIAPAADLRAYDQLRGKCSKSLLQLLQLHKGLACLDLSGVHLSWLPGPDFEGGNLFSDLLKTGRVLTELHLNNVPFGNDGVALLAKALKERIQPPNAAAGMGRGRTWRDSSGPEPDSGGEGSSGDSTQSAVGGSSGTNGVFKSGSKGGAPLVLRVLSLSRVNMDSLGFGFLLDALAYDPEMPLQQLDLSYNRIRYLDIDEWKRFLAVNRKLCSLDLQFNLLTMDVWSEARELLDEVLKMRRTEWFFERDEGWGGKPAEQLEVLV